MQKGGGCQHRFSLPDAGGGEGCGITEFRGRGKRYGVFYRVCCWIAFVVRTAVKVIDDFVFDDRPLGVNGNILCGHRRKGVRRVQFRIGIPTRKAISRFGRACGSGYLRAVILRDSGYRRSARKSRLTGRDFP